MKGKNHDEMIEYLIAEGIIELKDDLWHTGPNYELIGRPFCEGLTEEKDIEVKQSLLTMQVRFLKRGKTWTLQRIGVDEDIEHILLSTQPVKNVQFTYHPPVLPKRPKSK